MQQYLLMPYSSKKIPFMSPLEPQPLSLVIALDSKFETIASVCLASFLTHNDVKRVCLFTPSGTHPAILLNICKLFNVPCDHITLSADGPLSNLDESVRPYFYCVEAIYFLSRHYTGRFIYLDSDTLCCRPIPELTYFSLDLKLPIAACTHGRPMHDRCLLLDLPTPYHYFNAGVLLFDCQFLANFLDLSNVVKYFIANSAICRFREQCALNYMLKNSVRFLPNQYNYLSWMRSRCAHSRWHQLDINPYAYCLPDVRRNLAIVHFSNGHIPLDLANQQYEHIDRYWLMLLNKIKLLPTIQPPPNPKIYLASYERYISHLQN